MQHIQCDPISLKKKKMECVLIFQWPVERVGGFKMADGEGATGTVEGGAGAMASAVDAVGSADGQGRPGGPGSPSSSGPGTLGTLGNPKALASQEKKMP